jgi:hypothetical protein
LFKNVLAIPIYFAVFGYCWRGGAYSISSAIKEHYALDAGHFKTLTAAHVLAAHEIVFANHIALSFRELGSITVIGSRWQRFLLSTYRPRDLVLRRLVAVRTI